MFKKLLAGVCAALIAGPALAQYPLAAGPVPYVSTPSSSPGEAANLAINNVNKYLSGQYGGVAIVNPTFTGTLTGPTYAGDGSNLQTKATGSTTARTQGARAADVVNLRDYGAKCDGSTDDTLAIQAWINALGPGKSGYAPAGTCEFSSTLLATGSGYSLIGGGPYATVFQYNGSSTTVDLIKVGDPSTNNQYGNIYLSNFRIASSTKMTAGTALRLYNLVRSELDGVIIDGQNGNGDLWNGIWFDQIDNVTYTHFEAVGQADALRVNGAITGPKADLYLSKGKIGGSGVGIHIGGAFGGFTLEQADVIGNGQNLLIDTALTSQNNRELVFGAGVFFDSSTSASPNVEIADTLGGSTEYISFNGTWIASGQGYNLQVDAGVNAQILYFGGTIFNGQTDGYHNASTGANVFFDGTWIRNNGQSGSGYGVSGVSGGDPNQILTNIYFLSNASGNADANTIINSNVFGTTAYFASLINANGGIRFNSNFYMQIQNSIPTLNWAANYYEGFNGNTINWYANGINALALTSSAVYIPAVSLVVQKQLNFSNLFESATAPTVASGLGSSPTVTANGTGAFKIVVGSGGGSSTSVLALPTAANGWACTAQDVTNAYTARESAVSATSVTHSWSTAPAAGDVLVFNCGAY